MPSNRSRRDRSHREAQPERRMSAAGEHLDLDAIADLEEGLADDADPPDRRAHLETCDICGDRLARLRTARALLSALPAEQMPSDVAARVAAALPDEPPLTTIVPRSRRRRWSRHPSFAGLGAVAAGVALIAAVVIGATHRSNDSGSGSDSGAAAGANSAPQPGPTHFPVISSGTVYTDASAAGSLATLDRFVRTGRLASDSPAPEAGAEQRAGSTATFGLRAAPVPAALRRLHDNPDALMACVAKLTA